MTNNTPYRLTGCAIDTCNAEVADDSSACPTHRARLAAALDGGLARLYVELNIALRPGQTGNDDPHVTTSSSPKRPPISLPARAAQQDMLALVLATETALRQAAGFAPAPRRGREGPTLVGACTVLHDHLDTVLALPAVGADFATRLLRITSSARFAAGKSGQRRNRLDVPCPSCDMRSLARDNGTDLIACAYCAAVLTAQQLDDLLDPPARKAA